MTKSIKYPIGQQSFARIREENCLYVDKTQYIRKIIESGGRYFFLSRPRRFGKSLFLSTLKCFFEGRRDLFKGLYIDSLELEWTPSPVFLFDLNLLKYKGADELGELVDDKLRGWEKEYGIVPETRNHSIRFSRLLEAAYRQTGRQVVILVDEYDKPLVNNLHDRERFEAYRDELAELYSNFKSSAEYIRLVFMTGVSRFGKLSVFSGLNNIKDISFSDEFAAICGITEEELYANFRDGIEALAEKQGIGVDEEKTHLKKWYDGYHFTAECPDIYNPFSLLNAMEDLKFGNYWIESGTPSLLVEQLKKEKSELGSLVDSRVTERRLSGLDIENTDIVSLFYQTGYLTIKGFDERRGLYQLGLPNDEVTEGFYDYVLPYYVNMHGKETRVLIYDILDALDAGDVDQFMNILTSLFAGFSYDMNISAESDVRNALCIIFRLLGMHAEVEYRTSDGRIDILVGTRRFVYIIELKYDRSSEEALAQIKRKEYQLAFAQGDRKVIGIGINFSSDKRRIDDWLAERL